MLQPIPTQTKSLVTKATAVESPSTPAPPPAFTVNIVYGNPVGAAAQAAFIARALAYKAEQDALRAQAVNAC